MRAITCAQLSVAIDRMRLRRKHIIQAEALDLLAQL